MPLIPRHDQPVSETTPKPQHPWEISPQEVEQLLSSGGDFLFLDCRKPEERETARIEGTTLVPMHDLDLHMDDLRRQQHRMIVVHCHGGKRSMIVTTVLRNEGFTNVMSMAGGIDRWSREIDPSVPRY